MAIFRSWAVVLANILVPLGLLVFSSGFFPYKPLLPGLATFDEYDQDVTPAIFDKVVFMVVDALRSDFVYSNESGFSFTQSLIRAGAALPFTAHASSPTVTMPRLKAMTTGSVPSFLDVILNIAESDTSSTLAYQDTWLAQLRARGDRLVMYGDDTWLKLFPGMFDRADGTTSFFVSDFTEVDNNVTRHVPDELAQSDWSAMIMHYLGLDHIGHKAGPKSPFMLSKQQEMDAVVNDIYTAIQQQSHLDSTLFVLCGDHGMNEGGNHGGSSAGETSPALLFISPKFESMGGHAESPVPTPEDLRFYQTVQQSDITTTLAGLLGLPIPLNSLGVFIPDFLDMWESGSQKLQLLSRNAQQLLKIVQSTFPSASFDTNAFADCDLDKLSGIEEVQCAWSQAQRLLSDKQLSSSEDEVAISTTETALLRFSRIAQEVMSSTASNYDMTRLCAGVLILAIATSLLVPTIYSEFSATLATGVFIMFMVTGYGSMMFASSYVEEEQQFWYWICSGWIFYLHIRSESSSRKTRVRSSPGSNSSLNSFWLLKTATLVLFITHRFLRRWNQTGQKFTAEPDIAKGFFPSHPGILWGLVILTYADSGYHFFKKIPSTALAPLLALTLPSLAFLFKLNFVTNDSPELLVENPLSNIAGNWILGGLSLVWQAKLVFFGLAGCAIWSIISKTQTQKPNTLLHETIHLFLITQSRITNIPLFLIFRLQSLALSSLHLTPIEITTTTLISQYTTFFAFGGSNAISSVDLSSAYNGVESYNVILVGILTFVSNWAGPIWWVSMGNLLRIERAKSSAGGKNALKHSSSSSSSNNIVASGESSHSHSPAALFTFHIAASLLSVMAACTALRTHLFIWTVFSPKYLYSMAWAVANHGIVNLLGGIGFSFLWG